MTRQTGYIKISRAIQEHLIWRNAEHLKWWLDLLFLAAWKDTDTLKRGQLRASVRYLQERWARYDENGKVVSKPSPKRVIAYLRQLEAETLISMIKAPGAVTLITITNYECYQGKRDVGGNTNGNTNGNTSGNEYKEYINNNIAVVEDARTHDAREGNFSEELENDMTWCEAMQINHHINRATLLQYINKYEINNICNAQADETLKDAKYHFNNWLRIRMKDERDEQRKDNSRPMSADEARAKRMQEYAAMLTTVNPDGTVKHGS